jgi:hypothetical protein
MSVDLRVTPGNRSPLEGEDAQGPLSELLQVPTSDLQQYALRFRAAQQSGFTIWGTSARNAPDASFTIS